MIATETDPNVKVPNAILRAAARADEIHKQAYQPGQSDGEGADPVTDPVTDPPVDAQDPPSEQQAAPPQDNPPTDSQTPNDTPPDYERMYRSMKGRFDRAEQDKQALIARIDGLQATIATIQAAPPTPAPAELEAARLITPAEEEEFGREFLDVVGKRAKETITPEVQELRDQIKNLKAQLEGVQGYVSVSSQSKMEQTLDTSCPNWREVNLDQNFLSWLALPDLLSGITRHDLLKAAWDRKDGHRVAAFFIGFLSEEAASAPAGNEPHQSAPVAPKVPLETFAAPGRAKTAAAGTAPAEKPVFTRAQIAAFYADRTAGRYKGREQEANRLEAEIFAAQQDGRIRQ